MVKKTTSKKSTKKKTAKSRIKKASKKTAAASKTRKTAAKKKKPAKAASKKTVKSKGLAKLSPREKVIQKIKQDLIAQKESLLKEAEETLNALPSDLNFPDMGDQATAETDRNFMLRLRDRERMLLKKIDETIDLIESSDDYGTCEECGSEIGIQRLKARPVTTFCIECKTRQEEEERISEGA